jgi:hypothetical protein
LISPVGDRVNPINLKFTWSQCSASDTVNLYIFAYTSNTGFQLISQTITTASQQISMAPFDFGKRYRWTVNRHNIPGDTIDFTTMYNDTLATGTFLVNVYYYYGCSDPQGDYYTCDSSLGSTKVSVKELGPGTLLFSDTSIVHTQFSVSYSSVQANPTNVVNYVPGYMVQYGNPDSTNISVSTPNNVAAVKDTTIGFNNFSYRWYGTKIQ